MLSMMILPLFWCKLLEKPESELLHEFGLHLVDHTQFVVEVRFHRQVVKLFKFSNCHDNVLVVCVVEDEGEVMETHNLELEYNLANHIDDFESCKVSNISEEN